MKKPLFKQYPGIKSVGGFITVSFTKVVENPFVNGIYITGPGAGTRAIGGLEDGSCNSDSGPRPSLGGAVKFSEDYIKLMNGTKAPLQQIGAAVYGPDARLYLGSFDGHVHALTLTKDFRIKKQCTASIVDTIPRVVVGLAFNPFSSALKLHLSTSTLFWNQSISDFGAGWTNGKVETITVKGRNGCFNDDRKPVSNSQSTLTSLEFLPTGELLVTTGGFTNAGISALGDARGGVPSNPLSGAIVTCPATGTAMKYSNMNNPVKAKIIGGACRTYATGLRSSVGMKYHTNGNLYATDNGAGKGYMEDNGVGKGMSSTDCVGGMQPLENRPDKLHKIVPGKCHEHPNINRGECLFDDPQCVQPLLGKLVPSVNGVLEYRSNTFQGIFKSNLFLAKFAGMDDGGVIRVQLNKAGTVKKNGFTEKFFPKSGLAITEGPRGEMVMPRLQQGEVLVLRPIYEAPAKTALISVLPRRCPAAGGSRVLITGHRFGMKPKATFGGIPCKNVKLIDADSFTCVTPALRSNSQVSVVVSGSAGVSSNRGTDFWAM